MQGSSLRGLSQKQARIQRIIAWCETTRMFPCLSSSMITGSNRDTTSSQDSPEGYRKWYLSLSRSADWFGYLKIKERLKLKYDFLLFKIKASAKICLAEAGHKFKEFELPLKDIVISETFANSSVNFVERFPVLRREERLQFFCCLSCPNLKFYFSQELFFLKSEYLL